MFRMWGKIIKDNRLIKDTVIINDTDHTRTGKILETLESICVQFDLSKPIWLEVNINEFKTRGKTRFYSDSFIEPIDFDYLEIQIIEE